MVRFLYVVGVKRQHGWRSDTSSKKKGKEMGCRYDTISSGFGNIMRHAEKDVGRAELALRNAPFDELIAACCSLLH